MPRRPYLHLTPGTAHSTVSRAHSSMELITDGWFNERSPLWPGQCLSLKISGVLHHERSKYQDILLVQTESHGKALILDGIIQCTERDEFSYQEMISMLPLEAHPNPEKVLIVGGGDGGVAREAHKHPLVKQVHQVEIDERVVALSKEHLPFMSKGFQSHKLSLHIADGFQFLKGHPQQFDVIITDSSDPIGPNESLFRDEYFRLLRSALRGGGVICSQAGTPWLDATGIRRHMDACRRQFQTVQYALTSVPSYPSGQIGFVIARTDKGCDMSVPMRRSVPELRYYNPETHSASFVLPKFARDLLFL